MRSDEVSGDSKIRSGANHFQFRIRRRLASLVSIECSRRFSYRRLRQLQTLKLSVLKLDGSEFEVDIMNNATIAELKTAIEEVFGSSAKEGQDKIPWSLVWGHFCLCYEGQKLVNDKVRIRNYGIKEGDQLQFIRHISVEYSPLSKRKPKKERIGSKRNSM